MKIFHGIAVSPGIAEGVVYPIDSSNIKIPKYWIHDREIKDEKMRFSRAVESSKDQIQKLKQKLSNIKGKEHQLILEGHLAMLDDPMLKDATLKIIENEKLNAEWALSKSENKILESFSKIDEEYFKERQNDIIQVIERVLNNLLGKSEDKVFKLDRPVIVVAKDLSPADLAHISRQKILGFATDVGGRTSHTGIVAASMEIPAVVGAENLSQHANQGDLMIIDGIHGVIILDPTEEVIQEYREIKSQYIKTQEELHAELSLPSETQDHHAISLFANMELLEEVSFIQHQGAQGIGLFRTEFFLLDSQTIPSEQEQADYYAQILECFAPLPVTMRTYDLGGEKSLHTYHNKKEPNPALGLRAIRYCLKDPHLFKTQLRALLRASKHGNLRIMFPLISGLYELLEAKKIFKQVKQELVNEQVDFAKDVKIGIMIETPSSAMVADLLAPEVDFFSVGTNDLIQYSLAVDRVNEHVAYLYNPLHPAILRTLQLVVQSAKAQDIPVYLCGEMASDPIFLPILVALGFDGLSMNAIVLPKVKHILRMLNMESCQGLFQEIIQNKTAHNATNMLIDKMITWFPNEFEVPNQ